MARKKKDRPLSRHSIDELKALEATLEEGSDKHTEVRAELTERERIRAKAVSKTLYDWNLRGRPRPK